MQIKEPIGNKSDEPSGTEQIVCHACRTPVSGRVTQDPSGSPTAAYHCPRCGTRSRNQLARTGGGA